MSEIVIGTGDQGDVTLDIARLIESQMLIQATTGGGKTTTLRRILEQSHGMVQQLVIDPEGEFYTLREKYDYIIAGKGGDCAADPRSAKLLAKRLLELGVSAICDLSELKMHDRIRFVRFFCEALIEAPRAKRVPALVVIDEAHLFCPEKGQAESAPAVIDLSARGRKRQLSPLLATQRLAKLHKDAAAQLGNVLIGRTGLDIDQQRAADVLGFAKAERIALRDLQWREFYAFGPAFAVNGVQRILVGDTVTKNPKMGDALVAPPPPTEKMRTLLAKVADLPAEAEAEARDLATVQRQLLETRRLLAGVQREQRVGQKPCDHEATIAELRNDMAHAHALHTSAVTELEALYAANDIIAVDLTTAATNLRQRAERSVPVSRPPAREPKTNREPSVKQPAIRQADPRLSMNGHSPDLEGLKAGARKILNEIASRYPATWTRSQVGALTGFTPSGGTFQTYFSELKRRGLIAEQGGAVSVTDAGLDAIGGAPPSPTTHDEMMAMWRKALKAGCYRMLEAVAVQREHGIGRDQLAGEVEMTASGGTFQTYLSILKRNGLVEISGAHVVATDVLWPEGAR